MADKTLAQSLLRTLWSTGLKWPEIQNAIGVGKHLVKSGIPDSVGMQDGRLVLTDKDVTDPETVGDIISMPPNAEAPSLPHELRHSDQADVLGPGMILAKPIEALLGYGSGPMERDAYRKTEPNSEFLRKPGGAYSDLIEALFRKTLR